MTLSNDWFRNGGSGAVEFGAIPAKDVSAFHDNSDVDSSTRAQHHTLGNSSVQAAAGDHTHSDKLNKSVYDIEHTNDADDLAFFGDSSWTHQSRLHRWGKSVSVDFLVSTAVPQGAGANSAIVPAIHRPCGITFGKYFWGMDASTGNAVPLLFTSLGEFKHVFARSSGQATYATISYVAKYQ